MNYMLLTMVKAVTLKSAVFTVNVKRLHDVLTVTITECPLAYCYHINNITLCSSNYSIFQQSQIHSAIMSLWVGLCYLCFSTVHLWRVLNVRRTCG